MSRSLYDLLREGPTGLSFITVGPVWRGGQNGEDASLASCYRNCFRIVEARDLKTVAFPAISTGVYGFPLDRATRIALRETKAFLGRNLSVERVVFVCFGERAYGCYQETLRLET